VLVGFDKVWERKGAAELSVEPSIVLRILHKVREGKGREMGNCVFRTDCVRDFG